MFTQWTAPSYLVGLVSVVVIVFLGVDVSSMESRIHFHPKTVSSTDNFIPTMVSSNGRCTSVQK